MQDEVERPCPECKGPMYPIKIIDKTHHHAHADLEYTVPEATRGFWLGQFPVEGKVLACMCDRCGRILLYGT